jgi:hypothetical protein
VARLLIERGAPLEAKRQGGQTPLRVSFLCLKQQSEWTPNEYTLPIAEALIEAGASVEDAELTLTGAVCLGRGDDVTRLAKEADAVEKQRALAAAAYNGSLDAIDPAIALGADPNAPNVGLNPNATALHNVTGLVLVEEKSGQVMHGDPKARDVVRDIFCDALSRVLPPSGSRINRPKCLNPNFQRKRYKSNILAGLRQLDSPVQPQHPHRLGCKARA